MQDLKNLNELIRAAKEVLGEDPKQIIEESPVKVEEHFAYSEPVDSRVVVYGEVSQSLSYEVGSVQAYEPPPPATNVTQFQKFGDLPSHLRDAESINWIEIKKLNLAIALEALDRAATAHENFPSPDASLALSTMSDTVLKLAKDLEKSQDPQKILEDILQNALASLTQEIVQDLAGEMKSLREQTSSMLRLDKKDAFDVAFKTAVNRMGPAMKERLETAKNRIAKVLGVKEKSNARRRD